MSLYDDAVIALPMRLIVSIVIGTAVLIAILSFTSSFDLISPSMSVSINPLVYKVNGSSGMINLSIYVSSTNGKPVDNAVIIVHGLGGFASAVTNASGRVNVSISIVFPRYIHEGYLDVTVKAQGFSKFFQENMIRVIQV